MLGFFDFYLSPKSHLMRIVKTTTKPGLDIKVKRISYTYIDGKL